MPSGGGLVERKGPETRLVPGTHTIALAIDRGGLCSGSRSWAGFVACRFFWSRAAIAPLTGILIQRVQEAAEE